MGSSSRLSCQVSSRGRSNPAVLVPFQWDGDTFVLNIGFSRGFFLLSASQLVVQVVTCLSVVKWHWARATEPDQKTMKKVTVK